MALPRVLLGNEHRLLMSDLKELSLKELYAVYRHVTQHREQAVILNDNQAIENADWLLAEVKNEIKGKA